MLLFASAEAHNPNPLEHVMNTFFWEIMPTRDVGFRTWPFSKFTILMMLAAAIICAIYIPLAKHIQKGGIPRGTCGNLFESVLEFIRNNVVKPYIHHNPDKYVPFLWTMFLFILVCN